MGAGGTIKIVNGTNSELIKKSSHEYQMDNWSFDNIGEKTEKNFYIEWCNKTFKDWEDDGGECYWNIGDLTLCLTARNPEGFEYGTLAIQWSWPEEDGGYYPSKPPYYMISPTPVNGGIFGQWEYMHRYEITLGFVHDGTVTTKVVEIQQVIDQIPNFDLTAEDVANYLKDQKNSEKMQEFMNKVNSLYP